MKSDSSRLLLCTLATAVAVTAGDAQAFPNPFKRKDPDTAPAPADAVAAYRTFGADELVLYCYAGDPSQVDTLAGVLGLT